MTFKLLTGTALAVALTVGALAQAPRTGSAPTPRDGVQTRAEVVERVQTMFSRMDSNRDGALTQDGTRQMVRQMQRSGGERADANRDGQLTRDERLQARRSMMGQRRG